MRVAYRVSPLIEARYMIGRWFTPSEIGAMFTTPAPLLPDDPSKIIMPRRCFFYKEAGTAWTLNSATQLNVIWNSASKVAVGYANLAGFMDQASALSAMTAQLGNSVSAYVTVSPSLLNEITGKGLAVSTLVANMSGGTGNLFVRVIYDILDSNFWAYF